MDIGIISFYLVLRNRFTNFYRLVLILGVYVMGRQLV